MTTITGKRLMAKAKKVTSKKTTPAAVKKTAARPRPGTPAAAAKKGAAAAKAPAPPRSRKSSYSKTELNYFRTIIMEKKKEILEELETLRDSMMDATTGEYASESSMYSTHMEQGTDAMEREKTFLFASREGKFLNYLEDALQRIDKGVYGKCSECGKLIEKERLEAVPHARQCLNCKMKLAK